MRTKKLPENEYILPTLPQKKILDILKKRPLEDRQIIQDIEKFFLQKRRYIFQIPPPHTPVILLLSGGLDSTIFCDILMRKYSLQVYPLYLRRGQIRMPLEEKAVDFFTNYYSSTYPKLFHKPAKVTSFIPPLEIRWNITKFGEQAISSTPRTFLGIPMYSSLLLDYAVQYAYFLEKNKNITIRDIFCGFMPIDGTYFRYETLTALRTNMYTACSLTNDYSWQFTSLALEKECGYFFEKDVLISWAKKNKIPIEKSNSCIKYSFFHCGVCGYCKFRKKSFADAYVKDRTTYLNDLNPRIFFKILNKVLLLFSTTLFLLNVWITLFKNFLYYLPGD